MTVLRAQVTGLDKLREQANNLPPLVRQIVAAELSSIADDLVDEQKVLASRDVRTGKGRDHIRKKIGQDPLNVKVVAADAETEYMFYLEVGTVKEPARPFFFPPYRAIKPTIAARLAKAVRDALGSSQKARAVAVIGSFFGIDTE